MPKNLDVSNFNDPATIAKAVVNMVKLSENKYALQGPGVFKILPKLEEKALEIPHGDKAIMKEEGVLDGEDAHCFDPERLALEKVRSFCVEYGFALSEFDGVDEE